MSDRIEVNISILEQDAGIIQERIASLKKDIGRLYDIVVDLNAMWEGESKTIFLKKLSQDKESIRGLLQEAERISDKMAEAVTIYKNCENAISQEIDEIHV